MCSKQHNTEAVRKITFWHMCCVSNFHLNELPRVMDVLRELNIGLQDGVYNEHAWALYARRERGKGGR